MLILISKIDDDDKKYKWVYEFPNILIYNKSNIVIDKNINNLEIPKNGGHIYSLYYYIYNNYDNLDDHIIFLSLSKESIFPDMNLINLIWSFIKNEKLEIDFKYLSHYKGIINLSFIVDPNESETCKSFRNFQKIFDKLYFDLFGYIENKSIELGEGGNFLISKKSILSRSKEFYKKILDSTEYLKNNIEYCNNCLGDCHIDLRDFNCYLDDCFLHIFIEKVFTGNYSSFTEAYYLTEISNIQSETINECDNECDNECENEFDKKEICFKPKNNYCDFCNKIENVQKPLIEIKFYCSEKCQNQDMLALTT